MSVSVGMGVPRARASVSRALPLTVATQTTSHALSASPAHNERLAIIESQLGNYVDTLRVRMRAERAASSLERCMQQQSSCSPRADAAEA